MLEILTRYWLIKTNIKQGKDSHDIAQWIIADSKKRNAIESDHHLLTGEAIVAIIAGRYVIQHLKCNFRNTWLRIAVILLHLHWSSSFMS